jgi:hypothetical protein
MILAAPTILLFVSPAICSLSRRPHAQYYRDYNGLLRTKY